MPPHLPPPESDHIDRHHTSPHSHHTCVTTTAHHVTTYTPTEPPTDATEPDLENTRNHQTPPPQHLATAPPNKPPLKPPRTHHHCSIPWDLLQNTSCHQKHLQTTSCQHQPTDEEYRNIAEQPEGNKSGTWKMEPDLKHQGISSHHRYLHHRIWN